jgi:hypothetical protein
MRCTAVLGVVVVVVVMSGQGASHASWNARVSRSQGGGVDIYKTTNSQGALFRHHLSNRTAGMVCVLQILSWFFSSSSACVSVYFVWRDDRDRRKRIGCPFGCSSTPYIGKGDVVDIDGSAQ